LVREEEGDLVGALADARSATARAPRDWAGWLTRARIELELTQVRAARRSLSRARALNPRSPVFKAHR
jgi:Flp pilus assembly protein TadD